MRKISVYIEGERIELFNDENIVVNSSYQNYKDLAKIFTDFSQSFTVPASERNNEIFQHFYQTDVDTTLNFQLRREAKIDIDHSPFRTGKIQLEKANLKNGMPESYTITFYGDLRSLSDIFGDDKLNVLDLSGYAHNYTGAEVQTRITSSASYDVRYPLISSNRLWSYGGGTTTDISSSSYPINYSELFPALRINNIFQAIESKYNISIQGSFLYDKRWNDCYLYLKNRDVFEFYTDEQILDITTDDSGFDSTANTLQVITGLINASEIHTIEAKCTYNSNSTDVWYLDVYRNGVFFTSLADIGTSAWILVDSTDLENVNYTYQFKLRATAQMTLKVAICYKVTWTNDDYSPGSGTFYSNGINQTLSGNINLNALLPDMKVADFVSGVFKEFNIMCTGVTQDVFKVQPLEDWYASGLIRDFTQYTDINSIDIERIKLYKRIAFKHEESQSFMNVRFKELNSKEYGSLEESFDYDGQDYEVKVPFENLLHQKFTGTDLQVGYCLQVNDYKPYIPKPMLLYMYENKTCSFYFNNGTTTTQITTYKPFGQDLLYNGNNVSLNFGNDISSLLEVNIPRGMYQEYYSPYILNLYRAKNRVVNVKMHLPITELTTMRLNDRIIIRDKRYIINEMKSNLNTGEVDFQLILDFRALRRRRTFGTISVGGGKAYIPWELSYDVESVQLTSPTGISFDPASFTADQLVEFGVVEMDVPANPVEKDFFILENGDSYIDETSVPLRSEYGAEVVHIIEAEETRYNGEIETLSYTLIQSA
jgi:hypothetical protein